jgi:hypothetical protein
MKKLTLFILSAIFLMAQDIYLSYDPLSHTPYNGEVFEIKAKAIIAADDITNISTVYTQNPTIKILSENNIWRKIDDGKYELFLLLQVKSASFKLPDIRVTTTNTATVTSSQLLDGPQYDATSIVKSPIFCGVLAKELAIKGFTTTKISDEENRLTLEITASDSNLNDFRFDKTVVNDQKMVQNLYTFSKSAIKYDVTLPASKKIFEFEFFNLSTNKFEKKNIPVKLKEDEVSTQSELAPKSNISDLYQLLGVFLLAAGLYYYGQKTERRFLKFLAFASLLLIYPLMFNQDTIVIKKGSMISILPTTNSTIFEITKEEYKVEKLFETDKYYKIKLENDKVGWVAKENVL